MDLISISTPATTANLGPGFDCLGVALELHNQLEASWENIISFNNFSNLELVTWLQRNTKIAIKGEGENELLDSGMSLFFKSLATILSLPEFSCPVPKDLTLQFINNIPLAGGLGSSAACIISALCLGREVLAATGYEIEPEILLAEAVKLEGHPDNVCPAFLGGARLIIVQDNTLPLTFPLEIPGELNFIFAVPKLEVRSFEARRILPQTVILKEAVENSALLGALILSLKERNFTHLKELIQSPLHISYRSQLIPGYRNIEKTAYKYGALAFTISGAGPGVLALAVDNCKEIGIAMAQAFKKAGVDARYFISKVDLNGVKVRKE